MRLVPSDRAASAAPTLTVTDDAHAMRISHLKDRIARSEYCGSALTGNVLPAVFL